MLSGADVRKFRQALGKSQRVFAAELGLSQGMLSLIELGRTPVTDEHLRRLRDSFNEASFRPTFEDFVRELQKSRRLGQAMLGYRPGCNAILTVWRWRDDVDLSVPPPPDDAVSTVSLHVQPDEAIAFQMKGKTQWWEKDEILVFARADREDCRDQDLCLVQLRRPRHKAPQTALAVARISGGRKERVFQLQPIRGAAAPVLTPEPDELLALLRCVYRARYV